MIETLVILTLGILFIVFQLIVMARLKRLVQLQREATGYLATMQYQQAKAARLPEA